MTAPKTLLQMAGAPQQAAPLSQSAVIIVDAQNEYLNGALALPGVDAAIGALGRLIARARAANVPVIHIAHKGREGGLFDRSADNGAIMDALSPLANETVIEKGLPNAFAGTPLDERLKSNRHDKLVIAGFMTHMCVSSTARAALDLGYSVTVPSDACATRDLPGVGSADVVRAADLHHAELAALADRFAIVVPVAEIPD